MAGKLLILTVDYELFGNGSGCLDTCVLEPASRMLAIAERFNAPLTFFVEALEFMEIEKAGLQGVESVRKQIGDAVGDGNDAQLHLHPQWEGAEFLSDGTWALEMNRWRIGDLPPGQVGNLLRMGSSWLCEMLKPVEPAYRCIAFRAGGWCIQPSAHVLKELRQAGILIDSTVAPGVRNVTRGEWSDFRNAPDRPYWKVDDDVCRPSGEGLWEIPIATARIGLARHVQAVRTARQSGNGGMSPGCRGSYQGPDGFLQKMYGKFGKLAGAGMAMLDFSVMPADVLIDVTKDWIEKFDAEEVCIPVVAIAHTKNFTPASEMALAGYLEWAKKEGILFSTFAQWLRGMHDRE